jgi:hypothetical protein
MYPILFQILFIKQLGLYNFIDTLKANTMIVTFNIWFENVKYGTWKLNVSGFPSNKVIIIGRK